MSLGVIGLVIWLIRWAIASRGDRENRTGKTQSETLGQVLALVIWLVVGTLAIAWAVELGRGDLSALPRLLSCFVVLFPWTTLRLVLIPLGLVRTAYYTAFLCLYRFGADRRGGALLVGAWALLRTPADGSSDGSAAARFIAKRLDQLKVPRGAAVAALALGAARRGELEAARTTMQCLQNFDPAACPPWALQLADEWLSVDAVARGDWPEVKALTAPLGTYSRLTRFLAACAHRFLPADTLRVPSNAALFWRWLRAPHRRATWPLLQRAQNTTPTTTAAPTDPPKQLTAALPADKPELSVAMRALVVLLDTPSSALTEDELVKLCRLWDAALGNPETHLQLAKRALSLEHGSSELALRELRTQVAELIGTRLRDSGLPIGKLLGDGQAGDAATPLGATAAHTVRTQLLEEIEQACSALHDRTTDKRALPILDEWREWAQVRKSYHRVCRLGGLGIRRLAWTTFHREACNWAVWLWNERREKVLANAVFRFLLTEAEELQDESRITLARKNVASGI